MMYVLSTDEAKEDLLQTLEDLRKASTAERILFATQKAILGVGQENRNQIYRILSPEDTLEGMRKKMISYFEEYVASALPRYDEEIAEEKKEHIDALQQTIVSLRNGFWYPTKEMEDARDLMQTRTHFEQLSELSKKWMLPRQKRVALIGILESCLTEYMAHSEERVLRP